MRRTRMRTPSYNLRAAHLSRREDKGENSHWFVIVYIDVRPATSFVVLYSTDIYIYIIRGFLIITGNSLLLSGTKRSWIVILYQSPAFISMLTPLSKKKYFTDYKKNTWCRSSHVTSREAWQKHLVYRNRPDHSSSGLMTSESLLMGAGNGVAGPGPPSFAWNDETGTRSNSLSLSRPRHSAWKSTPSALTGPLNVPRRICEERFFRP